MAAQDCGRAVTAIAVNDTLDQVVSKVVYLQQVISSQMHASVREG